MVSSWLRGFKSCNHLFIFLDILTVDYFWASALITRIQSRKNSLSFAPWAYSRLRCADSVRDKNVWIFIPLIHILLNKWVQYERKMLQNNEMCLTRTKMDPKSWKFRSWTVPATRPSLAAILSEWHRLSQSSHRMWVTLSLSLWVKTCECVSTNVSLCERVRDTHMHTHTLFLWVCV